MSDGELIALVIDYLERQRLLVAASALERESQVRSPSASFLRRLLLAGRWDSALDYIAPLRHHASATGSGASKVHYRRAQCIVLRYKYAELLSLRQHLGGSSSSVESSSDALLRETLEQLEALQGDGELSEAKPTAMAPHRARFECLRELEPLLSSTSTDASTPPPSAKSRLESLLIKGVLYESAELLCMRGAHQSMPSLKEIRFVPMTTPTRQQGRATMTSPLEMSLLCWLCKLPRECFTLHFEERAIPLRYEALERKSDGDSDSDFWLAHLLASASVEGGEQRQLEDAGDLSSPEATASPSLEQQLEQQRRLIEKRDMDSSSQMMAPSSKMALEALLQRSKFALLAQKPPPPPPIPAKRSSINNNNHSITRSSRDTPLLQRLSRHESAFRPALAVYDESAIRCAKFHPSGDYFAVGSNSRLLRVCQVAPPPPPKRTSAGDCAEAIVVDSLPALHKGSIFSVAWNRSGSLIATGSNDTLVKFSAFTSQHQLSRPSTISQHTHTVRAVLFLDDQNLLSAGVDATILSTDCTAKPSTRQRFQGHEQPIMSLCHSSSSNDFFSGSDDCTVRAWDTRQEGETLRIDVASPVRALASTDALLFCGLKDGVCTAWDRRNVKRPFAEQQQQQWPMAKHEQEVRGLAFCQELRLLLTASYDGALRLSAPPADSRAIVVENSRQVAATRTIASVDVARGQRTQSRFIGVDWQPASASSQRVPAFVSTSTSREAIVWALDEGDKRRLSSK